MSKDTRPDVWFPLVVGDYLKDTARLTTEQHGAYLLLLMDYWVNGPPPDDDRALAAITGLELRRWRQQRPTLLKYFRIEGGVWRQKRADEEIVRWTEKKRAYSERARAGGKAKAAKSTASSTPKALLESCSSSAPREVDAPTGQSTLSGRERPEARADGASVLRVIEGGGGEREAWANAIRQAETDLRHFTETDPDPDFASEIAEFIATATGKLNELEAAA